MLRPRTLSFCARYLDNMEISGDEIIAALLPVEGPTTQGNFKFDLLLHRCTDGAMGAGDSSSVSSTPAASVEAVDLSGRGLSSINAHTLQQCTSLTHLTLASNRLEDLAMGALGLGLAQLTRVTTLDLGENSVCDDDAAVSHEPRSPIPLPRNSISFLSRIPMHVGNAFDVLM